MDPVFYPAILAIYNDDPATLRALLHATPHLVNQRSTCSHPTLLQMVAVDAKQIPNPVAAAQVLVEEGALLSEPLVAAASVDARDVLLYLLTQGINVDGEDDWSPLDEALYWGHMELAQLLVQRGAQVSTLRAAAALGSNELVHSFLKGNAASASAGPIRSPFANTVPTDRANRSLDVINNAFVSAIANGHQRVAKQLLDCGAQINAKPPGFHWKGTALHVAIWRGHETLVRWLLEQGADPTIQDGLANSDAQGWARYHKQNAILTLLTSHESNDKGSC